jgi:uncharacterized protein (DUF849 family)
MIVQACINGARQVGYHPRLPVTPAAIIDDAVAAVGAGAAELHLHIRGEDGSESLAPEIVDRVLRGLRARLPGTFIGISTGAWIEGDDPRRLGFIDAWSELPDYASVNLAEEDAPAVYEHLAVRGIGVEAGLAAIADVERLLALGLAELSLRVLVEISETDSAEAHATADLMLARLREAGVRKPILIHGEDDTVWSFVERAARDRLSTRVGLEDGNRLPDGRIASSNAEIVAAAIAIMSRNQAKA